MIFPLYFERLCWEHLINLMPLFIPLRIFKDRFLRSLRSLRFFTFDYKKTFHEFTEYYLKK